MRPVAAKPGHGQALLLLCLYERRQIDDAVASGFQLSRTRHGNDALDGCLDDRYDSGTVTSRIGLHANANKFTPETDLWDDVTAEHARRPLACILVDEAQFLSREQVLQLARLADEAKIPVLCYGLRTDFQAELFPGSAALLGIADALIELKAVCHCGRKSTMNMRVDESGRAVTAGEQTEIGGNDRYVAMCRKHFMEAMRR